MISNMSKSAFPTSQAHDGCYVEAGIAMCVVKGQNTYHLLSLIIKSDSRIPEKQSG